MMDWPISVWILCSLLCAIILTRTFKYTHYMTRFQLWLLYVLTSVDDGNPMKSGAFLNILAHARLFFCGVIRRFILQELFYVESNHRGFQDLLFLLRHSVFRHEFFQEICNSLVVCSSIGNYGMVKACLEACHDVIITCREICRHKYDLTDDDTHILRSMSMQKEMQVNLDDEDHLDETFHLSENSWRFIRYRIKTTLLQQSVDSGIRKAISKGRSRILKLLLSYGSSEAPASFVDCFAERWKWDLMISRLNFKIAKALLQDPFRRMSWYALYDNAHFKSMFSPKNRIIFGKIDDLIHSALKRSERRLQMRIDAFGTFLPRHLRLQIVGQSVLSGILFVRKRPIARVDASLEVLAMASIVHLSWISDTSDPQLFRIRKYPNVYEMRERLEVRLNQLL